MYYNDTQYEEERQVWQELWAEDDAAPTPPAAPLRSNPVQVRLCDLYRNTPYTLTSSPYEREKLRGHEDPETLAQLLEQRTAYVWVTDEAWERLHAAPATLPLAA